MAPTFQAQNLAASVVPLSFHRKHRSLSHTLVINSLSNDVCRYFSRQNQQIFFSISSPTMPSPIPLTSSVPNIANTHTSLSSATKNSSLRKQKIRACRTTSKNNSHLNEANLEEFNRRNEERYAGSSPYYKGLLYFNQSSPSPDDSQSNASSSSFLSAIIKLQGLRASCFTGKREHDTSPDDPPPPPNALNPGLSDQVWIGLDCENSKDLKQTAPIGVQIEPEVDLNSGVSSFPNQDEVDIQSDSENTKNPMEVGGSIEAKKIGSAEQEEGADSAPSVQDEAGIGSLGDNSKDLKEILQHESSAETKSLRERAAAIPAMEDPSSTDADAAVEEKKFVWADKYRPKALKDFICNREKAVFLQNQVAQGEGSHFIFEGPPGVGKRTMVRALLREVFGPEKLETKEQLRIFQLKGVDSASIKVNMKISFQHVEINLPELCGYEKDIIVSLMESHATAPQCDFTHGQVIVLYQADRLSSDAQDYIRWIMERYKGSSKVVFCCSDASKLQPIRSVCTHIQLLPPSESEIVRVLEYIADQEGIELPQHLAVRIAENSKQNLRQAIRSFEASWQSNYPFKEDHVILTGWEEVIAIIARSIINEQSPKQLYVIRGRLQNLIEHNISPDFIFSSLVGELKNHLDAQFHPELDAMYREYNPDNGGLLDGDKPLILLQGRQGELSKRNNDPVRNNVHHFMRIEEFTAKFMSFYTSGSRNFKK